MGFGVWGLGFGVWVWGLGFGVWGLGFGVWGLGFGVWGLGFRVVCTLHWNLTPAANNPCGPATFELSDAKTSPHGVAQR